MGWGDFLELRLDDPPLRLVVALVQESRRPLVQRAAQRARERASAHPRALPVVFAPHMTQAGIEAAERVGVGWFDAAGNAQLNGPGILLHIEGRPPLARRPGRRASPFAPRSSRVARAFLVEGERRWTQKELIEATELAQGTVSRALSGLSDLGLVNRDDRKRYWAPAPGDLLDAWRDEYTYDRHEILPVHRTGGGMKLATEVGTFLRSEGVRAALTGFPAAWLYDNFAQFRLVSVYVATTPLHAAELIGARVDERGANIHLIRPVDDGVFYGSREIGGMHCVHPVQAYLDLAGLPERAPDAADHLRQDWIRF